MNKFPLVSVILTTYNSEKFISETINSVLNQDYPKLEIVCGDDYSIDNTRHFLKSYYNSYPEKIKLVFQNENVGISQNFNSCLDVCEGDYIFLIGGDDIFLPGKLKHQVDFMMKNVDTVISYHDVEVFSSETGHVQYLYSDRHGFHQGGANTLIANGTFCCGCSIAVRNQNLPKADVRIKYSSDWLWYIDILKLNPGQGINYLPGIFSRYRRHSNNITTALAKDPSLGFAEECLTFDIITQKYPEYYSSIFRYRSEREFVYSLKFIMSFQFVSGLLLLVSTLSRNKFSPWYFLRRKMKFYV